MKTSHLSKSTTASLHAHTAVCVVRHSCDDDDNHHERQLLTMASIEATDDLRAAQKATAPVLFPTPPAALQVPSAYDSRPRVDSQTHFGIRPALAALQNTFTSRRRASSVSDAASQMSVTRSPHFARFMGMEPRSRTGSSATVVPQNAKSYPSALSFPIIESPDERAPRIPSFYDMDSDSFGHDLGLSLGLNPRYSTASTVRALSLSLTPEEARAMKDLLARNHFDQHQGRVERPLETSLPLSGSAQDTDMSLSAPQLVDVHARDTDALAAPTRSSGSTVNSPGSAPTSTFSANPSSLSDTTLIDADTSPVADATTYPRAVDTNTKLYPAADSSQHTYPGGSHAQQESDLYMEGLRVVGGALPSPVHASGASSPVSLRSPARSTVVSPTRALGVSPVQSRVVSPVQSRVVSPMGSLPTTPAHNAAMPALPSPSHLSPTPTSPSNVVAIPFPSSEESRGYVSDDDVGYDTPTLYTGTTNTSPTLSVTRVAPGEAPPALRLGPGMGFAGVGSYAGGGGVQGGVYVAGGAGTGELLPSPSLLSAARTSTADSGVSGFGRAEVEKDGEGKHAEGSNRSLHAESSGRSVNAESSGRSVNAESSGQSTHAESSSGPSTGIRARVTSLRTSHALSVLIPAFMKRARRKSRMGEEEEERRVRGRMVKEKKKKGARDEQSQARTESSRARTESSRGRTESSRPRTERTESSRAQSVSSSHHESDEEDISPASSHLDLLSADPFASTVAFKVGAWSQMYASSGTRGRSKSAAPAPTRNVDTTPHGSALLDVPALPGMISARPDSAARLSNPEDNSNEQLEYDGSFYADDDSEEESSIRIYSHGRGRSLSQPDVYTIPIEPLHQSTTTRRSGSSLARRARGLGNWRRPAIASRPSLPTLSTLSQQDMVMPVPRSAAAARFPAEPWADVVRGNSPGSGSSPMAGRGLGSLEIPRTGSMPGSPARTAPFPRSPMRGRMGSETSLLLSECSIAEDEDEYEEEDDEEEDKEDGSRCVSGGEEGKVWWSGSGSSSRASMSRRSSFMTSAAEEDEEPTIQVSELELAARDSVVEASVRDSVASTTKARDSVAVSEVSMEDVASESFLQTLDELDSRPLTPPPSSRSSSEPSVEDSGSGSGCGPIFNECPTGVGPRYPRSGAGGMQGGGAGGGSQQQGGGGGWKGGAGGNGGGHGYSGSGSGAGGNGGNGSGPRKQAAPDAESSESSSESESDAVPARTGRSARGRPSMAARSQSMPRASASARAPVKASSDESDNVPLAQRIPTALRAQKSIRIQDQAGREERRQKRLDRMRRRAEDKAAPTGGEGGIAPDELAKRLLNVQVGAGEHSRERSPLPSPRSPMPPARPSHDYGAGAGGLFPASTARSRTVSNISNMTRSRTHTRNASTEQPPPLPNAPQASVSRSGTLSRRAPPAPEAPPVPVPRTSMSRSGTLSRPRRSQEYPREGASLSRSGTAYKHRTGSKTDDEGESSRFQRSRSIRDPSSARPPMPPIPLKESYPVSARRPSQPEAYVPPVVEQRIYIGDRQKFVIVDVGPPSTTAKDVIEVARQRGELEIGGAGGWQLWEQSNECGMERPIRDFEFVNDVLKAWNPEKRVNVLIIRRSPLWGILKPENIPSSSPTMSGWVMWTSKPGKWSKRWLQLKEHCLFVCKNDKGKDQTFVCGLSNFDGYIVTHVQRAPKGFVFAAKSTESSGVFEKEEESSHIFSCDREIGEVWLQKILLARSYILQQERAVLPRSSGGGGLSASKSMLSRSGTKKSTVSSRSGGSQYPPPLVQDLQPSPFVEGSLLAKAAAGGI